RFRRERLIGELRSARALNHDECTVRRLMAGIAGLSELVERAGKLCSVANLDRFLNLAKRRHNNSIDHLADLHSLVVRNIPDRVLQAFFQLIELIVSELPIANVAREPELCSMNSWS